MICGSQRRSRHPTSLMASGLGCGASDHGVACRRGVAAKFEMWAGAAEQPRARCLEGNCGKRGARACPCPVCRQLHNLCKYSAYCNVDLLYVL